MSSNSGGPGLRMLLIIASTRPARLGPAVADWFIAATRVTAAAEGVVVEAADLAEIGLPLLDEPEEPSAGGYVHEHTRAWSRRVEAADGFVVVTPEYNHGMPAALKNAVDFLCSEWAWKPVAFVSYGNTSAGTRSVQMAKQVASAVRMVPIGATVALRIADSIRNGQVLTTPSVDAAACRVVRELARAARALRPLRADREESATGPVDGLALAPLADDDLAELLVLQRCCWVQEAVANRTLALAPLHETLDDLRAWSDTWRVWCVRRHGRLVAAVRARRHGSRWLIGRLMVAPDLAGQGIGSWLLAHAEAQAPEGTTEVALFTGARSTRNIALYERAGYTLTPAPPDDAAADSVYLTKPLRRCA